MNAYSYRMREGRIQTGERCGSRAIFYPVLRNIEARTKPVSDSII